MNDGGSGIIGLGFFLLVWRYGTDRRIFVHLGIATGILILLLLSVALWYRPVKQESYYEQRALRDPIPSFTKHIPVDAVVYWEDDPKMTWFALGRANYASRLQTVGIVFSRKTAIEGKRRMDRLSALGVKDSIFSWEGYKSGLPHDSLKGLAHVCHDPVLDFVVLSKNFGIGVIDRYFEKITGKYFYLYDCSFLRKNYTDTWNELKTTTGKNQLSVSQYP